MTSEARNGDNLHCRVMWPPLREMDGETEYLVQSVECDWYCQWPGWQWVADRINKLYDNSRTPAACRSKYSRIIKDCESRIKTHNAEHDTRQQQNNQKGKTS